MANYKRMDVDMFARFLAEMKDNSEVVFATYSYNNMEIGSVIDDEDALQYFWFAEMVYKQEYDAEYIVIDYITGGKTRVIPLLWGLSKYSQIKKYIDEWYGNEFHDLYVEIKEG